MAQFSTHEAVSLEKRVDVISRVAKIVEDEDVETYYDVLECLDWIRTNGFQRVCLQFPDYLLRDAPKVALLLQKKLGQTVYILGDTAYESCCLDYVAAAHVSADAIIHYGTKCFSKRSGDVPSYFVYEKYDLNLEMFGDCLRIWLESVEKKGDNICLVIDHPYMCHKERLMETLKELPISINNVEDDITGNSIVLYLGELGKKLSHFQSLNKPKQLHFYNANNASIIHYETDARVLKKRNYLREKIRDSQTIGIIIGTLAVQNYLEAIQRLKRLIEITCKKYYLISVGKPTVAKLANFPEMDVYVLVTCAMNEIYESRDFYRPIVTPHDVETALNPAAYVMAEFSYDFNTFLPTLIDLRHVEKSAALRHSDVSLLTGNIRTMRCEDDEDVESARNDGAVAVRADGSVAVSGGHGAGYLAGRTWTGLDPNLGRNDATLAEDGRVGIAQGYRNELN